MQRLSLALLSLLMASCGGESTPVTYASPALAAEAGAQALAGGDLEAAASAYEQAAANPDPAAKIEALSGLFRARLGAGADEQAIQAVNRLIQEGGASVTVVQLKSLTDAAINEHNAAVADSLINMALAKFPESKKEFENADKAVQMLKTEGAGVDLSALGYAGD